MREVISAILMVAFAPPVIGAEAPQTYVCIPQTGFFGVIAGDSWMTGPHPPIPGQFLSYTVSASDTKLEVRVKDEGSDAYEECNLTTSSSFGFQCWTKGLVLTVQERGGLWSFAAHIAWPGLSDTYLTLGTCSSLP